MVAGAIALYVIFVVDDRVPTYGPSMRPTLSGPGPLTIDEDAYAFAEPQRGDIVAAQAPDGVYASQCGATRRPDQPCARAVDEYARLRVIKRMVALPG